MEEEDMEIDEEAWEDEEELSEAVENLSLCRLCGEKLDNSKTAILKTDKNLPSAFMKL